MNQAIEMNRVIEKLYRQKEKATNLPKQEIDPNKWYGICYGRDLSKEFGKGYQ